MGETNDGAAVQFGSNCILDGHVKADSQSAFDCQRQLDWRFKCAMIRAKAIDPKDSPGNMPWIYTIWSRSDPKLLCVFASL